MIAGTQCHSINSDSQFLLFLANLQFVCRKPLAQLFGSFKTEAKDCSLVNEFWIAEVVVPTVL